MLRLAGTNNGYHLKNWEKLPGRVGEPMAVANEFGNSTAKEQVTYNFMLTERTFSPDQIILGSSGIIPD
jgi:hypothetical protein